MLDGFPPEILSIILDLAAPTCTTAYYENPRTRSQLLCTYSLVCKATYKAAQRLARRKVFLCTNSERKRLKRRLKKANVEDVRVVRVAEEVRLDKLNELLEILPRVEEVQLIDVVGAVVLEGLRCPSTVTTLALKNVDLLLPDPLSFPHVVELVVHNVNMSPLISQAFFSTATLPSLRRLAASGVKWRQCPLWWPRLDLGMLPRLELMQGLAVNSLNLVRTPLNIDPPILISLSTPGFTESSRQILWIVPSQYLRIMATARDDDNKVWHDKNPAASLDRLVDDIEFIKPQLKVLFLPDSYRLSPSRSPSQISNLHRLVNVCEAKGVEIVWHNETAHTQHRISPSFRNGTTLDAQQRYASGTLKILSNWLDNKPQTPSDLIVENGEYATKAYGQRGIGAKS